MAVVELDDQQGRCPWHNQSAVAVRCGKVGRRRNVMLEMKGESQIIRNAWKSHGYEWFVDNVGEQDAGGNDDGAKGGAL